MAKTTKAKTSSKKTKKVEDKNYEQIKLGDNTCLRISAFAFDDDEDMENIQINIRKFYRTQKDKTWKPARQGMTIPLEIAKKFRVKMKTICESVDENPEDVEVIEKKGRGD